MNTTCISPFCLFSLIHTFKSLLLLKLLLAMERKSMLHSVLKHLAVVDSAMQVHEHLFGVIIVHRLLTQISHSHELHESSFYHLDFLLVFPRDICFGSVLIYTSGL
uniref:Dynein light chain n=1 Tax=Percolomonas cosmopolitus TaxID=63605 RepID=A0A7S1PGI3_9EUKA